MGEGRGQEQKDEEREKEEGKNREREKRRESEGDQERTEQGVRRQNGAGRRSSEQAPTPMWSVSRLAEAEAAQVQTERSEVRGQPRVGSCWGSMGGAWPLVSKWSDTGLSRTVWSLMAQLATSSTQAQQNQGSGVLARYANPQM